MHWLPHLNNTQVFLASSMGQTFDCKYDHLYLQSQAGAWVDVIALPQQLSGAGLLQKRGAVPLAPGAGR